jgi:hypothetical protein
MKHKDPLLAGAYSGVGKVHFAKSKGKDWVGYLKRMPSVNRNKA